MMSDSEPHLRPGEFFMRKREAGVYTARGIHELGQMVASLAEQGFRIVTVIDTQNGDYHVVAQRDFE